MATLGGNLLTLADHAKMMDPKGKIAMTVELLSQTNEILMAMVVIEGHLPTGHQTTIRTGLPETYFRAMNQPVPLSKSTSAQITEQAALLEAWSEVDEKVAKLNGNVKQFRMNEATSFLESMNQKMAETLFYGDNANGKEFVGFAPRYNDTGAENGENILDAGGTGSDNASIWLIGWGPKEVHGIFPKGSKAGLVHEDMGLVTLQAGNDTSAVGGSRMRAYQERFQWENGLVVADWRYAVRIANIDISDLIAGTGTQAPGANTEVIRMLSRAQDRLPRLNGIKPTFYANRTIMSHLRVQGQNASSNVLDVQKGFNQFGQTIFETSFQTIPMRVVDALTTAEGQVT